ncbi:MAG: hypothetical protein WBF37_09250 [Dehalococcoidia bacterium]
MKKKINPEAIVTLKEALADIYWYKRDLRTFLSSAIEHQELLGRLDWNDYKRNIVGNLVDMMIANQKVYEGDLINLMVQVSDFRDFSHLERLEDGMKKSQQAEASVTKLKSLVKGFEQIVRDKLEVERRRAEFEESVSRLKEMHFELEKLKSRYIDLATSDDHNKRGFELESFMRDLFILYDLDPKASFKIKGEQIDGAFSFEGLDYLFEAKWQDALVTAADMDSLMGKIQRKLDNTLGLFLSISGFSDEGVNAVSSGRRVIILMDGADLMAVLEDRIDLQELIQRKRRHAAQTGNIYYKISEMFSGG